MAKGPSTADQERRDQAFPVPAERLLTAPPGPLERETLAWLLLGLFALFVIGFYVMRVPGQAEGNPLTFDRALFGSLSAVTLTGLPQVVSSSSFGGDSKLLPITLIFLTMGAGFLTVFATALPACRLLGMQQPAKRLARAAGLLIAGGTLVGSIPIAIGDARGFSAAFASLDPLLLAASAIGNSGVHLGHLPRGDAWVSHVCLLPLAIIGGLGLPVLLDLVDRARGKSAELMPHTRIVLTLTAAVYVLGVAAILLLDERLIARIGTFFTQGGWTPSQWREVRSMVVDASVLSLNSRSAGFPFENVPVSAFPRAVQWVLIFLMGIGAGPAGTAGGLKTTTLYVLGKGVARGLRGERLSPLTGFAIAWTAIFFILIAAGSALLLWFAPDVPPERLLTLAVSATSNSGLAHDSISIVAAPLMVLALLMALGRVVPVVLLWVLAERIDYTETVVG